MKSRSGEKIKLTSYDELFGVDNQEGCIEVQVSELHNFKSQNCRTGTPAEIIEHRKNLIEKREKVEQKKARNRRLIAWGSVAT